MAIQNFSPLQLNSTLSVGVDDAGHDVKFFGATSGRYMEWDESADSLYLRDNTRLIIGNNTDMQFYHQSSVDTNYIELSKKLHIIQNQNDGDILFSCDDGSGGIAMYLQIDGGEGYTLANKHIRFKDDAEARFGTGSDMAVYHDGSNSFMRNDTGNLTISNTTDDGDIILQSDDGSGGTTAYLTLDGSAVKTFVSTQFGVGGSPGAQLDVNSGGTNTVAIFESTDDKAFIKIKDDDTDVHLIAKDNKFSIGESSSDYDNFKVDITSGDTDIAGALQLNSTLTVGVDDAGHDVKFFGATAGSFLLWDESDDSLNLTDNTKLKFGDGNDFNMFHDGSNSFIQNQVGHLRIKNNADNKDIVFQTDDGNGSVQTYLTLDGGDETLVASVPLVLEADSTVGWHGSVTRVKILPRDFQPDNGGRPAMTAIATNEAYLASNGSGKLFASVPIPTGFKATHVKIHGSDTGQTFTVYHANIANKATDTIGTATAIETEKDIVDTDSTTTNYILIEVSSDGTTDEIHGGYMTIAPI